MRPPMDLAGTAAFPDLTRAVEVYFRIAAGRAMPHRNDFAVSRFRWLLGRMYLLDVLDGGADYRFRLLGQFWRIIFGVELSGCLLSELEAKGLLMNVRASYDALVANPAPTIYSGTLTWPNSPVLDVQRVLLPFAGDGGELSLILCAASCGKPLEDLIFFTGLDFPNVAFGPGIRLLAT